MGEPVIIGPLIGLVALFYASVMFGRPRKWYCEHLIQRAIYGDEIWGTMNWRGDIFRARCLGCGKRLPDLPPKDRCVDG